MPLIDSISNMSYLFTSESVSEGHPDKVADQISDALVDNFLAFDENARVACETLVTTGQVFLAGEVKSKANLDYQKITREVINKIGYNKSEYMFDGTSCGIISVIHNQSEDISRGVDQDVLQGAGDQGIMFGYATNETDNYMPLALDLSHRIMFELSELRRENKDIKYLRPDAKTQVTIEYSEFDIPIRIHTIVVSTQHDDFTSVDGINSETEMLDKINEDIRNILIPRVMSKLPEKTKRLFNDSIKYHINPTGNFVIGGPHGDTGLTGRKIIVDTYGGKGAHGGGAFSGKDPSKVDRSAAYATRHIAKNLVASKICDRVLVQVSYAIGIVEPMSISIDTYGTGKISDRATEKIVNDLFDMTPAGITNRLRLKQPMYSETAAYGHMGRDNRVVNKTFYSKDGEINMDVELFTWEKLDFVSDIKKEVYKLL